jgi:PQQ enzyme repeat
MSVAITTRSYDNTRSGANIQETILTPSALRTRGIKRLFALALPGDARGCEAQPLIVPQVKLADGSTHDVVYIATMANQIFAFDANTGAQLWMVQLGTPIKGTTQIDAYLINDHWGILSTPVIDTQAGVLYACAWISPDGTVSTARHFLCAVSLRDGSRVHPPLNLEGVSYNPGHGLPVQKFQSVHRKQRAALLLANGAVFIGFGTIVESASTARGWLIAVDTATFKVSAAWTTTSRGSGGGIWHSGGGPAADARGNIYVITGNGDFDATTDFGESIIKLQYMPPAQGRSGSLAVVDWWTPWTDDGRTGGNPEGEDGGPPRPSNFRMVPRLAAKGVEPMDMGGAWGDQDFGSGGPVLAAEIDAVLAAGKDGILYTANLQNLGKTEPVDCSPASTAQNYGKLKMQPIFYTYYPGPQLNAAPSAIDTLNVLVGRRTHHLHGTPVLWKSSAHGLLHFCWGENGNLRAWSIANSGVSTYLACSAEVASAQSPVPPGGMPGGMISLSADGETGGVLWASIPYKDANMELSPGRFLAYDAADFGRYSDGSGSIVPLWDSQQWNWQFTHNKFNRPVVWNGKVFLPTYDGEVLVLGLS